MAPDVRGGTSAGLPAALTAAACLTLASCGLIAPFDLGRLPLGDAGGHADADADTDADAPSDGDPPNDDADALPFDPLAGCTGVATGERWAVAVAEGGHFHGYVTDRDCEVPELVCPLPGWPWEDCLPVGFSPSGEALLVIRPVDPGWRLTDEIGVVHLETGGPRLEVLAIRGANPAWADDATFYYIAPLAGVDGPCDGSPSEQPEATELRRHLLSDAGDEDEVVGPAMRRAHHGGFPVAASADGPVAFAADASSRCTQEDVLVVLRDPSRGTDLRLPWTVANGEFDFTVGLLPSGDGFLVETLHGPSSSLYAVTFGGRAAEGAIVEVPAAIMGWVLTSLEWYWPTFGSTRRLGPRCEIYGGGAGTGTFSRISLLGGDVDAVPCDIHGSATWLMDVRQW